MNRKKINKYLYISAFFIAATVFLVGYIVGSSLNQIKLQSVYDLEHDIRIDALGNELAFELMKSDVCENINLSSHTEKLADIGNKLTYMEQYYGFNSSEVRSMKSYYSLLLVEHLILNENVKEQCGNINKQSVIYFYTNFEGCEDCEDQGKVLTNLHRNNPSFLIYSFEYAEDNEAIKYLKEKYDVERHKLPVIVINETPYYGFQSRDKLSEILIE